MWGKVIMFKSIVFVLLLSISVFAAEPASESQFYSFVVKDAKNKEIKLSDYKNKVVLIVNVASKCGYTYQYEELEELYKKYENKGLIILGFPSNEFFGQEPGTNEEIQKFCKLKYGVNFPVLAKIEVNTEEAIPLYKWLKTQKNFEGKITWNFNKFLLNKKGEVVRRFGSSDKPKSFEKDIINLLSEK